MSSTIKGRQTVEKLLGPEGPFADGGFLKTGSGVELFHKLTEAAPEAALKLLKRTIGRWDRDTLLKIGENRQYIVWSLEMIAVWAELFTDAATLLLALAEAEIETVYSNNATGTFCSLFKFGIGRVASTEAPPDIRIPILEAALKSDSKEKKLIALKACDNGLSTGPYTRFLGPEFQGANLIADLWNPRTYGELFDAYRKVWALVIQQIPSPDVDIRNEALNVLLTNVRSLLNVSNLFDMVLNDLEGLVQVHWIDHRQILRAVEETIHYDGKSFDKEHLNKLTSFRDSLIGTDYEGLLKRYVGMDLLEDLYDEQGERVEKLEPILNDLATRSVNDPNLIEPHVGWLSTHDAENGFKFGYALGILDKNFKLLGMLFEGARNVAELSGFFLGGYLKAVFESDKERWEDILDGIYKDNKLAKLLGELTWRSGITKRAAERVLDAAKADKVSIQQLQLFTYGGVLREIPSETFSDWAKFLLEETKGQGPYVLLDMFLFYYGRGKERKSFPREITLSLLTNRAFFEDFERKKHRQSLEYHWKEIAIALIKDHPDTAETLRSILLESFGSDNSVIWSDYSSVVEVLNHIAQRYPTETWETASKHLTTTHSSRSFHIEHWLRGEKGFGDRRSGALYFFNSDDIWDWVDEDIDKRALIAADFVPPFLFHSKDRPCFARELLCRYGDRKEVKGRLSANFWSEGWSGPESQHYMKRVGELESFKSQESNQNVIDWVNSFIYGLQENIKRARIEEELEGR